MNKPMNDWEDLQSQWQSYQPDIKKITKKINWVTWRMFAYLVFDIVVMIGFCFFLYFEIYSGDRKFIIDMWFYFIGVISFYGVYLDFKLRIPIFRLQGDSTKDILGLYLERTKVGVVLGLVSKRFFWFMLMLTAQDTLENKLEGFAKGADDYLVKPFELLELSARVKALYKRNLNTASVMQVADLQINASTREATRSGNNLKLSPLEWKLMEYLMRQSPKVVARDKIESYLWPDEMPSKDALKMQLYRLRQIVDIDNLPPLIHTIRGTGVALRLEEET